MGSNKRLRAAKYGYIFLSCLFVVFGIVLMAVPNFSITLLVRIGGVLLIVFGGVKILGYCSQDRYRLAFQFDLALGILLLALGVILLFRTDAMLHIICTLLGIFVLADGLLKVQTAIDAKEFGLGSWWMILTSAVVTGIIGFLLIFRPYESVNAIMTLLGLAILAEGILNLITVLTAVKIFRETEPRGLEDDFRL